MDLQSRVKNDFEIKMGNWDVYRQSYKSKIQKLYGPI